MNRKSFKDALHQIYLFQQNDALFMTHLCDENPVALRLTCLQETMRAGDLFGGRVDRIEGGRLWVSLDNKRKPALLKIKKHQQGPWHVGQYVWVRIACPEIQTPRGHLKGARVVLCDDLFLSQQGILRPSPSEIGKQKAAPEEWLAYLMALPEEMVSDVSVLVSTEDLFFQLKKTGLPYSVFLKTDVVQEVPAPVVMAWQALLDPCVMIPGGGWVLIEEGETLTAFDVNTQSFEEGHRHDRDFKTEDQWLTFNQQAASVIQREIQLRQLSGLIILDFPRLTRPKKQQALSETLQQFDDGHAQLLGWTRAGLFEITRPRQHASLPLRLAGLLKAGKPLFLKP